MTTATVKMTAAKKAAPQMTKESMAASSAVADMANRNEAAPMEEQLPEDEQTKELNDAQRELVARVTEWRSPDHWSKKFAEASATHTACAAAIRGAHAKRHVWLGEVMGVVELYLNPPIPDVAETIERATRWKLKKLGWSPKTELKKNVGLYSKLIVLAAMVPEEKLDDPAEEKARREAIQKKHYTYCKVIAELGIDKVTASDAPAYLNKHGLENIRLGKHRQKPAEQDGDATEDVDAFKQFGADIRLNKPRFTIKAKAKQINWDATSDHPEVVLLATYSPTTNLIEVREVLKDRAAFDAVLRVAIKRGVKADTTAVISKDVFPNGI